MGLTLLVQGQPDLCLCGEASSGRDALRMLEAFTPDLIVTDLRMKGLSGTDLVRSVRLKCPRSAILVLSSYASQEEVYGAVCAGATGYLTKESSREILLEALRSVAHGHEYIPAEIAARLVERDPASTLTGREAEILDLLAKGLTNREIAHVLGISRSTAKTHLANIFTKLEVTDRAEAVSTAIRRGILSI